MKEQNRVNKGKNINTQKQETEMITGREEVGKGAIRRARAQGESAPKPKHAFSSYDTAGRIQGTESIMGKGKNEHKRENATENT